MNIDILVFDGVDELDALAPYRVLRGAISAGADFVVRLVTLTETDEITASCGLRFRPDGVLGTPSPDILVVPGGGWASRAELGAWGEARRGEIPAAIAMQAERGVTIATVCTGAMLAAYGGLVVGRNAITHHAAIEDLRAFGAKVVEARVVDDGDTISAGGVTSGLDLALWLVERFACPEIAANVARNLEYERRGTVWRRNDQ
ncbi:MAG: DJ-1/PfpI family protein [Thermomicrobiales bacterium]